MMRRYSIVFVMLAAAAAFGAVSAPLPALAQSAVEGRVDRLESEMRAVQRKVFPGGSGQYVQPDNAPADTQSIPPGSPASSPVADLTARIDSLEGQLRQLTGQVETNVHRLDLIEGRIKTLETGAAAGATPAPAYTPGAIDKPLADGPALDRPALKRPGTPKTESAVAQPVDPARTIRVAAVEKPDTGDAAEDIYLYGYRLWTAKLYPEAETQLKTVTARYATHKRASYAQNLLGRSYFDDGKPSLASLAFYDSYKKWPDGDRAPESLYYLAQSLVKLDKPAAQVCKVYTELMRSYGAKVDADARMKAGVAKGKTASGCS